MPFGYASFIPAAVTHGMQQTQLQQVNVEGCEEARSHEACHLRTSGNGDIERNSAMIKFLRCRQVTDIGPSIESGNVGEQRGAVERDDHYQ